MIPGLVVKSNVDAADVVFDASVDSNTFDMLSLSRICPLEKRVSVNEVPGVTVLYSPVETGRSIAEALGQSDGKVLYITGNNKKTLHSFDITESQIADWLIAVLKVVKDRGVIIGQILTDGESGVGVAAGLAAKALGIEFSVGTAVSAKELAVS